MLYNVIYAMYGIYFMYLNVYICTVCFYASILNVRLKFKFMYLSLVKKNSVFKTRSHPRELNVKLGLIDI